MLTAVEFLICGWSCWRTSRSLVFFAIAILLVPAEALAQVTYTGTTAAQNFGSPTVGSPTAATTLSFSVSAGTTVGSIGVVTQGAPNLDFTSPSGGTCAATTYVSASTCTVNVTFTPKVPGSRTGAVIFFSEMGDAGTVLGSVAVYGVGTGPQVMFRTTTASLLAVTANGQTLLGANDLAFDGAGDLFIADQNHNRIVELPSGGGAAIAIDPTVDSKGLNRPYSVEVDGAGDLFISDFGNSRVVKMPAGGGAPVAIDPTADGTGLNQPFGLAVDKSGDLFISDWMADRVVEVPAGGGEPIAIAPVVNGEGLSSPTGLVVDSAGDLFIADYSNSRVVEVPAGGGAATAVNAAPSGAELMEPDGLAIDGAGDLFIAGGGWVSTSAPGSPGLTGLVEVPAGGAPILIGSKVDGESLGIYGGVALDGSGNLYVTSGNITGVAEVQSSLPPTVNFPTVTTVGTYDSVDLTQTVNVVNVGNEALALTALTYPTDFPEASGAPSPCRATTSLSAGQECDVAVEFIPQQSGALSENITLTDNALNVTGAQQSIGVTGTAVGPSRFSITTTASVVAGVPFTITITALSSSNQIDTAYNGTVTFLSSDPDFVNPGPLKLADGRGQAVVTFYTDMTQTIQATDTVTPTLTGLGSFNVAALAVLSSPTPGTTIGYSDITFIWTLGYGVSQYRLYLGTDGPGSSNMFDSGVTRATTVVVPTLPALGVTVYARLFTFNPANNAWYYNDYTYTLTAPILAALSAPTPGTTVGYSNVMFTWTPNFAYSHYRLYLGVNGPGSSDIYSSNETSATSVVVPTLPALGVTLYARLFTLNFETNIWQYKDYTYTLAGPILATLTSPTPGTSVGTSNVTFTWTPNYAYSHYRLYLGTSGPGSANVYSSSQTSATSVMVPTLPATGGTLYARLFTLNSETGVWQYNDYIYTTAP